MKRSILIVICDFLILSALSLSTGVQRPGAPAGAGALGAAGSVPASTPAVAQPAIDWKRKALVSMEKVKRFLERLEFKTLSEQYAAMTQQLRNKNRALDEMTNANRELRKIKETLEKNKLALKQSEEALKRELAAKSDVIVDLQTETRDLKTLKDKLNADLKAKQLDLTRLDETLRAKEGKLAEIATKAQSLTEEKAKIQSELQEKEKNIALLDQKAKMLAGTMDEMKKNVKNKEEKISELDERSREFQLKAKQLEADLAAKQRELRERGEALADKERVLAGLTQNVDRLKDEKNQLSLSLKDKELTIDYLEKSSKVLVKGYSSLKNVIENKEEVINALKKHAETIKEDKEVVKKELNEVIAHKREEIDSLKKRLGGDGFIWEKYKKCARQLTVEMRERTPFIDNEFKASLLLPEIKVSEQRFLVAEFSSVGLDWSAIVDGQVSELRFIIADKETKTKSYRLTSPILNLNVSPRVCLFYIPDSLPGAPLDPIGFEKLTKRGLEDIYLFKKNGSSRELKCSFLEDAGQYLIIHNIMPDNPETKAEPGDFAFTKEGDFVGPLISESRCFIFPTKLHKSQLSLIPIKKGPDSKYYYNFANAVKQIKNRSE